jgi:peptidoglycan hydrolase-like protein with peptidoglycan-binding domain
MLFVLIVVVVSMVSYAARARYAMAGSAGFGSLAEQTDERAEWETGLGALSAADPGAFTDLVRQITLLTEVALARLGFNPGPLDGTLDAQTQEAVRRFEQSRHLPVTGDPMSFATMKRVMADEASMNREPVLLPPFSFVDGEWDRGRVTARGTWRAENTNARSDQVTSIVCDQRAMACQATTAVLVTTDGGGRALNLNTTSYEIDEWTPQAIATKADRDRLRLRLSRSAKSVVEEDAQGGPGHRELTDGSANYIAQYKEQLRARMSLMALSQATRDWLSRQPDLRVAAAPR